MTVPGRVVLIGATSVGKTSIIQRYLKGTVSMETKPTVGAVLHTHEVTVEKNGQRLVMQIWDTAGQERYKALGPIYYRKSHAAIAVYDVTNRESLYALEEWISNFRAAADDTFVVVAGNKCDLVDKVQVTLEEASDWLESKFDAQVFLTSAHTGVGVDDLFDVVVTQLVEKSSARSGGEQKLDISGTTPNDGGGDKCKC